MPQVLKDARSFVADRPWGARDLVEVAGASVRLHWTNQPYRWHVNDGTEVFVVLDGTVLMRYQEDGVEKLAVLEAADMFIAQDGDAHIAEPVGAARILVIEKKDSV